MSQSTNNWQRHFFWMAISTWIMLPRLLSAKQQYHPSKCGTVTFKVLLNWPQSKVSQHCAVRTSCTLISDKAKFLRQEHLIPQQVCFQVSRVSICQYLVTCLSLLIWEPSLWLLGKQIKNRLYITTKTNWWAIRHYMPQSPIQIFISLIQYNL